MKCGICGKDIEEDSLGKFRGTVIGVRKGESVKEHHVCNECQKEYKNDVKKKVIEMNQ